MSYSHPSSSSSSQKPSSSPRLAERGPSLEATTAARTRRYESVDLFERQHLSLCPKVIRSQTPQGWERFTHPEGKPYFHHAVDNVTTECDIQSKLILSAVIAARDRVRALAKSRGMHLAASTEMVIDVDLSTKPGRYYYYLIDWDERREFWCEDIDTETLGMDMAFSNEHLELAIREHFWTHVEYFPMHHALPNDVTDDLIAALAHAATDQLTSELSTAPWTAVECERFLQLLSYLKKEDGVRTCVVARLWRTMLHSQFINLYGHPGARLSRTQPILSEYTPLPSPRIARLCRIFLFNAPQTHIDALQELWVDRVVYSEHWGVFMRGLAHDWGGGAIMGTLVLAVNVSMLNSTDPESWSRLAGIASTLFSLSTIISAVLLLRRHRGADTYNAAIAGSYLEDTHHPQLGHQPLAIIFSLPYAFLLWSLIALTSSLVLHFSSLLSSSIAALSPVAATVFVGMGILTVTLYWAMVGFWKPQASRESWINKLQRWALLRLS